MIPFGFASNMICYGCQQSGLTLVTPRYSITLIVFSGTHQSSGISHSVQSSPQSSHESNVSSAIVSACFCNKGKVPSKPPKSDEKLSMLSNSAATKSKSDGHDPFISLSSDSDAGSCVEYPGVHVCALDGPNASAEDTVQTVHDRTIDFAIGFIFEFPLVRRITILFTLCFLPLLWVRKGGLKCVFGDLERCF